MFGNAPAHLPRLAALDALERTIYVSGFSKILVPNWRVGYLAGPAALVDRFVDTKLLTTLTTQDARFWRALVDARRAIGGVGRRA